MNFVSPTSGDRLVADIDKEIGYRVRKERISRGLNQQQLASLIGVTSQQVHKYESGANRIAAARLVQIARALDLPVAALLPEDDADVSIQTRRGDRQALEMARSFARITDPRQRNAVSVLIRSLLNEDDEQILQAAE
jgi:transcriptional regulator with XRE-family HTH domain